MEMVNKDWSKGEVSPTGPGRKSSNPNGRKDSDQTQKAKTPKPKTPPCITENNYFEYFFNIMHIVSAFGQENLEIKIQNLLVFVINNFNGMNTKGTGSDFFTKECYLLFLKVLVHFEIVISEIELEDINSMINLIICNNKKYNEPIFELYGLIFIKRVIILIEEDSVLLNEEVMQQFYFEMIEKIKSFTDFITTLNTEFDNLDESNLLFF
jgi:hypothetical protein